MIRKSTIVTVGIATIVSLLVMILAGGCASRRGLHGENRFKNNAAKWQMYNEHGQHFVQ